MIHIKFLTVCTVSKQIFFVNLIKVADEAILRNYLKEDLGWIVDMREFAFSNRIWQIIP